MMRRIHSAQEAEALADLATAWTVRTRYADDPFGVAYRVAIWLAADYPMGVAS
ncbi:hypothetical protein AB0K60_15815 [Thermopolyspora sp. NPDC052614]|uniref:hypothetical protein n=1 Tax=Thermopolyspora sp. NPDC052614 TaxID=3155682 RepID=UPI0034419A85